MSRVSWLLAGLLTAIVLVALLVRGPARAPAVAEGPPRLVSLAPQITETIAELGAQDQLVGRSDWCSLPVSVTALPAMGSALTPNLEAIAAARPTLVLVERAPSISTADLQGLAPVEALPWLSLPDVLASVRRLGVLLERPEQAEQLARSLGESLSETPPAEGAPRVLLALAGEGLGRGEVWYIKRNSLHGAALHAAGARNAVDEPVAGAPVLSVEALLALDPDAIVLLAAQRLDPSEREAALEPWKALQPLTAVQRGKVAVLGGPELLSTGPSMLDFVHELQHALVELEVVTQ